jgi:hypothetical protein
LKKVEIFFESIILKPILCSRVDGWIDVKAILWVAYSNKKNIEI